MSNSTSPTFTNTNMDDHLEGTVVEGVQGVERDLVDTALTVAKNTLDDLNSLDSQLESVQDDNLIPEANSAPTTEPHSRRSRRALDREATVVFDTGSSTVANQPLIPTRPNSPITSENPGLHHALRREGAIIINASANRIDEV